MNTWHAELETAGMCDWAMWGLFTSTPGSRSLSSLGTLSPEKLVRPSGMSGSLATTGLFMLGVHGVEFLGAIPWSDGQALVGGIWRRVLALGAAEQNLLSSAQACEVERAKQNRESITAGSKSPEKGMRCQEKLPCRHPWPSVPDSGEWDKVLVEEAQRRREAGR